MNNIQDTVEQALTSEEVSANTKKLQKTADNYVNTKLAAEAGVSPKIRKEFNVRVVVDYIGE